MAEGYVEDFIQNEIQFADIADKILHNNSSSNKVLPVSSVIAVIECKECKNSSNKLLTNILNCDTLEQEKTIPVTFNNYTRCNLNFTHNINKVCYATAPVWL